MSGYANVVDVKRGDVGVIFTDTLAATGLANLNNVTSLLFLLRNHSTGTLVSKTATVTNSATLTVQYVTQSGDLGTAGVYLQEWELTFNDGSVLTFPSRGYNLVRVADDLN